MKSEIERWEVRPPAGDAERAFILFHGRGADEFDLFPLFDILDPDKRFLCATPRGPLLLPPGGAHWYEVRRIGYPDPATFMEAVSAAAQWLDTLLSKAGLSIAQTVLGGFSQGAVMAHALALGEGRTTPAGVMAMSGFIPRVDEYPLDLDPRAEMPVIITHGSNDWVIGVEWGHDARDRLAAGADVTYLESAIQHGIDPDALPLLTDFLARRLP